MAQRRSLAQEQATVRWSANLPQEDVQRFVDLFPIYGISSTITIAACAEVIRRTETDPAEMYRVRRLINRAREAGFRVPGKVVQLTVRMPHTLHTRYAAMFSEIGSNTWLLRSTFYTYLERAEPLDSIIKGVVDSIMAPDGLEPVHSFDRGSDE